MELAHQQGMLRISMQSNETPLVLTGYQHELSFLQAGIGFFGSSKWFIIVRFSSP